MRGMRDNAVSRAQEAALSGIPRARSPVAARSGITLSPARPRPRYPASARAKVDQQGALSDSRDSLWPMGDTERIRAIFMALPEVTERPSHGAPTWFIRDKKSIATFWPDGHHQDEFPHLWCAAPPGSQVALVAQDPGRYFRPPYVGHRGWIGIRVDAGLDWAELAEIAEEAFRAVAPKTLIAKLDDQSV